MCKGRELEGGGGCWEREEVKKDWSVGAGLINIYLQKLICKDKPLNNKLSSRQIRTSHPSIRATSFFLIICFYWNLINKREKFKLRLEYVFCWNPVDRGIQFLIDQKYIYYPFLLHPCFFNPYCLECLLTRFPSVLGGLTDSRTTSTCPFPMAFPRSCSRIVQAKNGFQIGSTDPSDLSCWSWDVLAAWKTVCGLRLASPYYSVIQLGVNIFD